ncbi:hypothetical protein K439DRAFT_80978 [Ramaria rubella]|nr:hypothetical protein K439DRAFT_80978 [Ramaria rubella]
MAVFACPKEHEPTKPVGISTRSRYDRFPKHIHKITRSLHEHSFRRTNLVRKIAKVLQCLSSFLSFCIQLIPYYLHILTLSRAFRSSCLSNHIPCFRRHGFNRSYRRNSSMERSKPQSRSDLD